MEKDKLEIKASYSESGEIHKSDSIILSNEDRDTFLKALENPPEPSKKLKQALKYQKRLIKD